MQPNIKPIVEIKTARYSMAVLLACFQDSQLATTDHPVQFSIDLFHFVLGLTGVFPYGFKVGVKSSDRDIMLGQFVTVRVYDFLVVVNALVHAMKTTAVPPPHSLKK